MKIKKKLFSSVSKTNNCVAIENSVEHTLNYFCVFFFSRLHAERELCRVQAIKSLNNDRLGNALDWALRSQDNLHVTSIADLILKVRVLSSLYSMFVVVVFVFHYRLFDLFAHFNCYFLLLFGLHFQSCCRITPKRVPFYART